MAAVDLQGRPVSAIAADADAVWAAAITEPTDEGGEWTGTLVRVDSATNEVAAEIPLGPQVAGYEDEVMLGAGSVWVLGVRWSQQEDAEYGSDLFRIDPATNAIVARIPVGGFHMVMGAGEAWVRFVADGVFDTSGERWLWTRVDARTNEPSQPFEFGDDALRLVTAEALWSVGYDEEEHVRVSRIDPETLEVEVRSEPIRSLFHDAVIDPVSGTVWVSAVWNLVRVDIVDQGGSVTTFEPSEGWNLVHTTIDPTNSQGLPIVWAANVPFSPDDSAGGFPSDTVRDLPEDGIVMTVIGPRTYTGDTVFPPATFPLTIAQGFCSHDQYETQPAAVGPLPLDELAVPPEHRLRRDHERGPAVVRERPARRGEERAVPVAQLGASDRPAQHLHLVTEHGVLELELRDAPRSGQQFDETNQKK